MDSQRTVICFETLGPFSGCSVIHRLTPRKALPSYSVKTEATLKLNQLTTMALILLAALTVVAAHGQQGQWAAADKATDW